MENSFYDKFKTTDESKQFTLRNQTNPANSHMKSNEYTDGRTPAKGVPALGRSDGACTSMAAGT